MKLLYYATLKLNQVQIQTTTSAPTSETQRVDIWNTLASLFTLRYGTRFFIAWLKLYFQGSSSIMVQVCDALNVIEFQRNAHKYNVPKGFLTCTPQQLGDSLMRATTLPYIYKLVSVHKARRCVSIRRLHVNLLSKFATISAINIYSGDMMRHAAL